MVPVAMSKSEREMHQRLQHALERRVFAIRNQPWRLIRNRRLRAEVQALREVIAPDPRESDGSDHRDSR